MNRREFLGLAAFGAASFITADAFFDEKMKSAPVRGNKIVADLHTHPASYKDDDETLGMLCAPGLVGLSFMQGNPNILAYEGVLSRYPGLVREIDCGLLARIGDSDGYVARTQEIDCGLHHVLAVGFEGGYFLNYRDAREAVEEVHRRNGVAILNHPYVTPQRSFVRYRLITKEEERKVRELCEMVDEVEVFNAQSINPTFGIVVPNMKKANGMAEKLAAEYGFKGTVASDAHRRLDQPKLCGVYIDGEDLCTERLKDYIRQKRFDNDYRRYVSRYSFGMGMFFS